MDIKLKRNILCDAAAAAVQFVFVCMQCWYTDAPIALPSLPAATQIIKVHVLYGWLFHGFKVFAHSSCNTPSLDLLLLTVSFIALLRIPLSFSFALLCSARLYADIHNSCSFAIFAYPSDLKPCRIYYACTTFFLLPLLTLALILFVAAHWCLILCA